MFNTMINIGFVAFNLTLLSYLLLFMSLVLWAVARIKTAAGFDTTILENPFKGLLKKTLLLSMSLSIISILIASYLYFGQ